MPEENKKKWYKTWWGILGIIFLFPLVLLILLSRYIWGRDWNIYIRSGLIALIWGSIIIAGLLPSDTSQVATAQFECIGPDGKTVGLSPQECEKFNSEWQSKKPAEQQEPVSAPAYEIVEKSEGTAVTNYKVLVAQGVDGKIVALEVKKQCNGECNIDIFDDRKALDLQEEYDQMMGDLSTYPEELDSWKEKNYIFVADHLVGYMSFDTDEYQEYPYKDWYYEELKGI